MNKVLKIAVFALFLIGSATNLAAQKFGYVNSAGILAELPAVRAAEADLEALQKQLQKRGEDMVKQFQTDVAALQQRVEAGELSPQQQQQEGAKLEQRQQEIGQFEQKMVQDLQEKRNELLEPIYADVNKAIEEVAKENGYTLIFDQQVLLYGEETQDVTAAVKSKLGI
ncbi:MAG: OmpH family outer membrane protein [Bacteroidota bacterium]